MLTVNKTCARKSEKENINYNPTCKNLAQANESWLIGKRVGFECGDPKDQRPYYGLYSHKGKKETYIGINVHL